MNISSFLGSASLIVLIAFAPGCAMETGEGDASSDENPALAGEGPGKSPAFVLPRLPNLVAVDATGQVPQDGSGYCGLDVNGNFLVRVKNTGNAMSAPSVVLIQGSVAAPARNVNALSPGATQTIAIPWGFATCAPDCYFVITVDDTNTNVEWDEQNTFYGWCVG